MKKKTKPAADILKVLKAISVGIRPQDIPEINIDSYLEEGLIKKTNHCPYLCTIGHHDISCTLEFRIRNEMNFTSKKELQCFTDNNCYNNFSSCSAYQKIHKEQLEGEGKYKECAYCCNSTRQFLRVCGTGKTFCIAKQIIVDDFNPNTICDMFNCYFGGHLHE